jgi:hypothetical protein
MQGISSTRTLLDLQWELCCYKTKESDYNFVANHARNMNKHEEHYHVHEQKLRNALLKFHCYLDGAAGFTIITDDDTLRHFFRQRDLCTRSLRWLQVI